MKRPTTSIALTLDLGELGERDVEFEVHYMAGSPETGRFGRPEDYDPGCDSEVSIVSAKIACIDITPLLGDAEEAIIEAIKAEFDDRAANDFDEDREAA